MTSTLNSLFVYLINSMMVYIIVAACIIIAFWLLELILRIPKVPNLTSKHVLITGCDSGFGNQLAKQLDGKGIRVIAACLGEKARRELATSLSQRSSTLLMNVTDNVSVQKAMKSVKEIIANSDGLWGLVNNAGIAGNGGEMDWWSRDEYKKVIDVNLFGLIDVTKVFTPLLKRGRGRIVNVASTCGRLAIPEAGYSISKFGVECFSDEIRVQLKAFGILVSIIEPGFFKTAITNPKPIVDALRTKWTELSPAAQLEFGGQEMLERTLDRHSTSLQQFASARTDRVVDAMEHALTARHPKKRYSVGYDAKFLWIPLSYMPSIISDAFLRRLGKVNR